MGLFSRTLSRLEELKKVLTRDPASRQFLALADEYRRQGQVKEAIAVLEQGLAQNPSAVAGHVALGRLLQQTGNVDSAISSFQAALRLDPQNLVALRQTADLYLAKGDKVEAIKKLKLFRGLSPGDREVNEIIRQLDAELSAIAAPRSPAGLPSTEFPAPPGPVPVFAFAPPPAPEGVPAPHEPPPGPPVSVEPFAAPPPPFGDVAPALAVPDAAWPPPVSGEAPEAPPAGDPSATLEEAAAAPFPESELAAGPATVDAGVTEPPPAPDAGFAAPPRAAPPPPPEAVPVPAPAEVPGATETLAALLRSQGHLGEAEQAYRDLAGSARDAEDGRRLAGIADEISAARAGTARGRLEAWVAPFARRNGLRDGDLVGAVEEVYRRLPAAAAVVTDLEGVPVVNVGPRSESEAMESLAAELTAFWKNARRSRSEIGEGALDALVLSGVTARAAVKAIAPGYALLLKTDPAVPVGRIRHEAARAAERLRPALL